MRWLEFIVFKVILLFRNAQLHWALNPSATGIYYEKSQNIYSFFVPLVIFLWPFPRYEEG